MQAFSAGDSETVGKPVAPKAINKAVSTRIKKEDHVVLSPILRPLSRKEQATLYAATMSSVDSSIALRRQAASNLRLYKRTQKVSWDTLGITEADRRIMEQLLESEPAVKTVKASKKIKDLTAQMKGAKPTAAADVPKSDAVVNDSSTANRDREVLRLAALGRTTTQIHNETGVSRRAVDRIKNEASGS